MLSNSSLTFGVTPISKRHYLHRPMTQKRLWTLLFFFFNLIATVQFLQYYIFYNSSYPFPYTTNLINSYGTFYVYSWCIPLVFFATKYGFSNRARLSKVIGFHLITALMVSCVHLFIMHLLNWLQIYQWTEDPFWSSYRYLLSKWLHIELMAYVALVFAWRFLVFKSPEVKTEKPMYWSQIRVKESGLVSYISVKDIRWIEAYDNYIKVWVENQFHLVRMPLKDVAAVLDPQEFKRIHRSAIVAIKEVAAIKQGGGQYEVLLHDKSTLKLSRTFKKEIEVALQV